jgi:type II secretory pathway predicted ATPase ExeA
MSRPRWLTHFGLQEAPFSKELDDDKLWVPSSRTRVLDRLTEAITERGHVLLTGEPGVGKTCVLRALRARLPKARFRLTYCHNATLGRRDFYRQLCLAVGLSPKATAASVFFALTQHVMQMEQERQHPVFLLDEAHLLHPQVLAHLHILTNYEWDRRALLSLVLVGLPELETHLRLRVHRSLYSRVHTRLRLGEAQPEDTAEYLAYRLSLVGCDRELFDSDAVALMHEAADGRLRDLDRLATDALKRAARRKHKRVDHALVAACRDDDLID